MGTIYRLEADMQDMQSKITQDTFRSLAFPVVKVRCAGPTDTRGSRWIAQLGRMGYDDPTYRTVMSYDSALPTGAENAIVAAKACLAKAFAVSGNDLDDYVAIPGSLDSDTYAFTFVPSYILNR